MDPTPTAQSPLAQSPTAQRTSRYLFTTGSTSTIIPDPPTNPNPVSTHSMAIRYRVGSNYPPDRVTLHVSSISPLPKSYRDAFNDPNWQNAMYSTLSRYKARLIANDSTQIEGIDVDETFSPVVKPITIQNVLSLATSHIG
ncbi:ribonuclease H-like domain-containing protein [Tanacetum coccineum]